MLHPNAPYFWNGQGWAPLPPSPAMTPNLFGQRPSRRKSFLGCIRGRNKEPELDFVPASPATLNYHHQSPRSRRRRRSESSDESPERAPLPMMQFPMFTSGPQSAFGTPHSMSPILPTPWGTPRSSPRSHSDRTGSPWAKVAELDEDLSVIDVHHNLPILQSLTVSVNPSISSTTKVFPLIVDLRMDTNTIWKRPLPGWDSEVELYIGRDEPATMPALSLLFLLSPLLESPIKVENPAGVTCGDIIGALTRYAQTEISEVAWKKLRFSEKADARRRFMEQRAPLLPYSALNPHNITNVDTWRGEVVFEGIRKEDAYTKKRLGWVNPACFFVDLEEPEHTFRYE